MSIFEIHEKEVKESYNNIIPINLHTSPIVSSSDLFSCAIYTMYIILERTQKEYCMLK